jgi:hypothetical protein
MLPPEPANDERPPLWPGMSKRAEVRLRWAFVIVWFAAGLAFAIAILDTRHWLTIAVIVGTGFVVMLVGGLWRALTGGRS